MRWLHHLFQKEKSERQLDAELRFHVEQRTQDLIAAGASADEARRRANLEFGGLEPTKEDCREASRASLLEALFQDVRYGMRMLTKNPGFTLAAAVTLALGIGANTAIFSIVNAAILRPLPYKDSSRIVSINVHTAMFPSFSLGVSWPDFQQIRSQASSVEQTVAYSTTEKTLTGNASPAILSIATVSDGFFEELGVTAERGRLFTEEDQKPGQTHLAVISDSVWRTRFGANPSVVGKTLILDKESYTVVGVAARGFTYPQETEAWLPVSLTPADQQKHTNFMFEVLAKLRPGQKPEKLKSELDTIAQRTARDFPDLGADYHFSFQYLLERHVQGTRKAYFMLLGAAALVLLISCANLASLLLARGSARQREMAVRAALGASAGRLLRQGLVESCLLALFGGVLGIMLAAEGVQLFRVIAPANTPRLAEMSTDSTLLWFSLITSLIAGILFGLVPARRAAKMNPIEALKSGSGAGAAGVRSTHQSRMGEALVALEVALAFVLLVGSALMTQTVSRLLHQNPGFRTDHLLTFDLPQPPFVDLDHAEEQGKRQTAHFKDIIAQVQQMPGIATVTASDHGMLSGMTMMHSNLVVDAAIPPSANEKRHAGARYILPAFFQTMGIPLVRGREFADRDTGSGTNVVIVNEAMARTYWGTLEALGKRISFSTDEKGQPVWNEVIGVVADAREVSLRASASPTYFLCLLQGGINGGIHLLVRTQTDPDALATAITRRIWSYDPDQPVTHVTTMSRTITESVGDDRVRSILLVVFAGVGFALALVGVYGVISYSVSRRIQEVGIRMALGASPSGILQMILRQGLLPVLAGVLLGVVVAFGLSRALASQFYGVAPNDPATFAGAAILVILVACLACSIPARRATRVDPLVALRYE